MELLEGETLKYRLMRGTAPVEQALEFGKARIRGHPSRTPGNAGTFSNTAASNVNCRNKGKRPLVRFRNLREAFLSAR
jgi:hypothetical protein